MKFYINPPSPSEIADRKVWALVKYFEKNFPQAKITIEVEYNSQKKYCIERHKIKPAEEQEI